MSNGTDILGLIFLTPQIRNSVESPVCELVTYSSCQGRDCCGCITSHNVDGRQ